jgi:pyridoxamine 5'-phosphate oxidase family protein
VIDDVLPPWRPRMIEIRGMATLLSEGGDLGRGFDAETVRITPARIISYGILTPGDLVSYDARDVVASSPGTSG